MNLNRLGTGTTIAAMAAIVLLAVSFLGWYELEGLTVETDIGGVFGGPGTDVGADELQQAAQLADADASLNAWEAFEAIDIAIGLAIGGALWLTVLRARDDRLEAPVSMATIAGALGLLAAVLILYRIIDPPELFGVETAGVSVDVEVARSVWLFVGFAAAAGIALGGWLAMQDESSEVAEPAGLSPSTGPPPPP